MVREDAPPGKRNPGPDRGGRAGPCTPGPPSEHPRKKNQKVKNRTEVIFSSLMDPIPDIEKTRLLLSKKTETR